MKSLKCAAAYMECLLNVIEASMALHIYTHCARDNYPLFLSINYPFSALTLLVGQ